MRRTKGARPASSSSLRQPCTLRIRGRVRVRVRVRVRARVRVRLTFHESVASRWKPEKCELTQPVPG